MFLLGGEGVSLPGTMFLLGGLCPEVLTVDRDPPGQRPSPSGSQAGVIHLTGMHTFSQIDYRKLVHVGVMEKAETDKWLLRASALERIFFVIWLCTFLVSLVLAIIA